MTLAGRSLLQILPADEDLVLNLGIDRFVNGVSWHVAAIYVLHGPITLCAITKRGDEEVLMIPFSIRIHDGVALPVTDRAYRLDELDIPHMCSEFIDRSAKLLDGNLWLEIKASQHVKHVIVLIAVGPAVESN